MKRRIFLWALVGFAVAFGWAVVVLFSGLGFSPWKNPFLWTLIEITCPIAIVGKFVALKYYVVFAVNAATYAVLGLAIELIRLSLFRSPKAVRPA